MRVPATGASWSGCGNWSGCSGCAALLDWLGTGRKNLQRLADLHLDAGDSLRVHQRQGTVVLGGRLVLDPSEVGLFQILARFTNVCVSRSFK